MDCGFKSGLSAREPHPIGIDQRRSAAKGVRQALGMIKVVRKNLHPLAKRILAARMVRQCADFEPTVEQQLGSIFARVAKRARDDHCFIAHSLFLHLCYSALHTAQIAYDMAKTSLPERHYSAIRALVPACLRERLTDLSHCLRSG